MNFIQYNLFSACTFVSGKMYAFTNCGYLPIVIDLKKKSVKLEMELESYHFFKADLMLSDEGELFALEMNGKRLLQYDVSKKLCRYLDIDCHNEGYGNYAAFAKYGSYVYIFPRYRNAFLKVNLETQVMEKKQELYYEAAGTDKGDSRKAYEYFKCGCQSGSTVWLYQNQKHMLVRYELDKDFWEIYKLPLGVDDCADIVEYKDTVHLLSFQGNVYTWDIENCSMKLLADCTDGIERYKFSKLAVTDKKLFLLPSLGKDIFCVESDTGRAEIYQNAPKELQYYADESWSKYHGYCEDEEHYYFAMRSGNFLFSVNKESGKEEWINFDFPTKEDYINAYLKYSSRLIYENPFPVREILSFLNHCTACEAGKEEASAGKRIWRSLKEKFNLEKDS